MPQYTFATLAQAQTALAARLADPGNIFWTVSELNFYLQEALRSWNALTEQFNADFAFYASPNQTWYDISVMAGSPRQRTITDAYLYTIMQYHLLEPPTGAGAWVGTSQFSLADLQAALQRRRDEMIQSTACNLQQIPNIRSTPNTRRTYFPDSTLEPRRTRFIPDSSYGSPVTLTREDTLTWEAFNPSFPQQQGIPAAWSVIAGPPLALNVDLAPNVPGHYDSIAIVSGPTFNPPAATLIGVPDDWSSVAKWGALSDLFARESEATDLLRADYCRKRFVGGLEAMNKSNWLLAATINGMVVDTPSMREADGYSPEWQNNVNAYPSVVTAGTDFLAPCPVGAGQGCSLIVVGNAPMPVNPGDFVQVSRDAYDVILDEAQFLAAFKQGGQEFTEAEELDKNFMRFAVETNKRLAKLGFFRDLLGLEGERQNLAQPR